ncbi:uncharacterized protein C6orf226 homolog [Nematolebias whitei]|uniref:uncharacterized protein C6orf226 homolog n=1 Tax=Nematolebias whitei TaxID=451745 RepID=UPI00189AD5D2|nr:uncharacterized protein C6orf226 homolog [Nematolebias whitei]
MEPVFLRFNSYNFEADQRFVDGLKTFSKSEKSREVTELLKLKLFFYNKFVEPIDQHDYKTWSSSSSHGGGEQLDQRTPLQNPPPPTSAGPEAQQLSFAEVMQLVQEGKEVPGVKRLDIKPSNQSPTPSQMKQVLKPWNTSASAGGL